ncbi:hypothetical protein [Marinicella sp. W31]|uniref:hypothetical protein n=1 Tax=Marinicella sp. W31 TaxID=3023713 RepID=UPI003757B892
MGKVYNVTTKEVYTVERDGESEEKVRWQNIGVAFENEKSIKCRLPANVTVSGEFFLVKKPEKEVEQ